MSRRAKDICGQTFGKLWVSFPAGTRKKKQYVWCVCDCCNVVAVRKDRLLDGNRKSCGCMAHGLSHGHTVGKVRTPTCESIHQAEQRCNNSNRNNYKNYGARGIKWNFESNKAAIEELGPRPEGTSIERIDNDGNYEPGNVRWATPKEQRANRRPRITKEIYAQIAA